MGRWAFFPAAAAAAAAEKHNTPPTHQKTQQTQPTVGEACQRYHELPLKTHGLRVSLDDRGAILDKLRAWPVQDVEVAVVPDGERILGLGE